MSDVKVGDVFLKKVSRGESTIIGMVRGLSPSGHSVRCVTMHIWHADGKIISTQEDGYYDPETITVIYSLKEVQSVREEGDKPGGENASEEREGGSEVPESGGVEEDV